MEWDGIESLLLIYNVTEQVYLSTLINTHKLVRIWALSTI